MLFGSEDIGVKVTRYKPNIVRDCIVLFLIGFLIGGIITHGVMWW